MKLIKAILRPTILDDVRKALEEKQIIGMTVSEVKGFGRQKGHTEVYRGAEYEVSFRPKVKIELAVPNKRVSEAIDTISSIAKTGKIGDGKIFILPIDEAVRIRTGEKGKEAL